MGALTSNRKRGADSFSWNFKNPVSFSPFPDYHHPAKKSRLLHSFDEVSDPPKRSSSSSSTVLKFKRYPPVKTVLKREPHAPVRPQRFRNSVNLTVESAFSFADHLSHKMGNWFSSPLEKYENTKRAALGSLRYPQREEKAAAKEVVPAEEDKHASEVRATVNDDTPPEEDKNASEVLAAVEDDDVVILDSPVHSTPPAAIRQSNRSLGVDDAEKLLEDLQLSQDYRVDDPRVYEKLLYASKKRDTKLTSLKFEIELKNKEWERHQSLRPQKKEEINKKDVEAFKPLTEEEEAEVSRAMSNASRRKHLVTHESSNISITGEVLQCLRPGAWLNDEVINLYLELLKEREKRQPQKFLKCHFFNTFFYKKLVSGKGGYNYQSVKRWTSQRKLGYSLYDCDKIFVPIHKEVHWCLAVINVKDKKFQYLDSLSCGGGFHDNQVIKAMARYFMDEVKDKNGKEIDLSDWQNELVEDLPQQLNGFDCGVFMIKYADFYSRDIGLCFNQEHMPYFRKRTAREILKLKAD